MTAVRITNYLIHETKMFLQYHISLQFLFIYISKRSRKWRCLPIDIEEVRPATGPSSISRRSYRLPAATNQNPVQVHTSQSPHVLFALKMKSTFRSTKATSRKLQINWSMCTEFIER